MTSSISSLWHRQRVVGVASNWWLLAVDDVNDLLWVAPTKVDGGSRGPVVWLVGCGGGPVRWFELLEVLFILGS